MAERLYWCQRPSELSALAAGGAWDNTPARRDILSTQKLPSNISSTNVAETSATATQRLWALLITDVRTPGGAISGTLDWCLGVSESDLAADGYYAVHAVVVTDDGASVLATLITNYTEDVGAGTEFGTTAAGLSPNGPVALSSYTPSVPYRVVIEIGVIFRNTETTSRSALTRLGATTGFPPTPVATDLTPGDTNVTTRAGWFEFSAALGASAGPSNDTYAGATTITTLPYKTQMAVGAASEDPTDPTDPVVGNFYQERKSVWFTWTADSDRTMAATTFGSNYHSVLSIWTGTPGAFVHVAGDHKLDAIGFLVGVKDRGNSYVTWAAQQGTTYVIVAQAYEVDHDASCVDLTEAMLWLTVGDISNPAYVEGDVLVGNNMLLHYDGTTGLVKQILYNAAAAYYSGSAIAADGSILIALFGTDEVERWSADLQTLLATWNTTPGVAPLTVIATDDGRAHVGFTGDSGGPFPTEAGIGSAGSRPVQEWDVAAGTLTENWTPDPDQSGPLYLEYRDATQAAFAYASLGREFKHFSITGGQQADLFALPADGGTLQYARLLPDGTFLLVDTLDIKRVQADGTVLQTYSHPDITNWHATKINADGTFWASNPFFPSDYDTGTVRLVQFDLTSGDILDEWGVPTLDDGPCGLGPHLLLVGSSPVIGPLVWVHWPRLIQDFALAPAPSPPIPPPPPPEAPPPGGGPVPPPDVEATYGPQSTIVCPV